MNASLYRIFVILALFAFVSPAIAATSSYELIPSNRVIMRINQGMTIDEIIKKVYPRDQVLWSEIKQELMRLNPQAFHPYSKKLITGTRLKLLEIRKILEKQLDPKTTVGYVSEVSGRVTARDINGDTYNLLTNSQIYEGDRLTTGKSAAVSILMDDGAEIHMKDDSVVKISEYVITNGFDNSSSSILDLLRGGFRKISGAIGGNSLATYKVQTGLATIGIRGTEYVAKLCNGDDCNQTVSRNDPAAKLHAAVLDGIITLTTDEDVQILMAIGEYGTASKKY